MSLISIALVKIDRIDLMNILWHKVHPLLVPDTLEQFREYLLLIHGHGGEVTGFRTGQVRARQGQFRLSVFHIMPTTSSACLELMPVLMMRIMIPESFMPTEPTS